MFLCHEAALTQYETLHHESYKGVGHTGKYILNGIRNVCNFSRIQKNYAT